MIEDQDLIFVDAGDDIEERFLKIRLIGMFNLVQQNLLKSLCFLLGGSVYNSPQDGFENISKILTGKKFGVIFKGFFRFNVDHKLFMKTP